MRRPYAYVVIGGIVEIPKRNADGIEGYEILMGVVNATHMFDQAHLAGLEGVTLAYAGRVRRPNGTHDLYRLKVIGSAIRASLVECLFMGVVSEASEDDVQRERAAVLSCQP